MKTNKTNLCLVHGFGVSTLILLVLAETRADPLFTLSKQLTSNDGAYEDHFGWSVAVSGDVAVVGAQDDDIGFNGDQGSAYVFERHRGGTDNWGLVKKLIASDGTAGDDFGYSVAVSGEVVVVGAVLDDDFRGAAYLFVRDHGGPNNWGEFRKLTASDGTAGDHFGWAVSISGDVVVAGAVGDDGVLGSAYVFERDEGGADNWGQVRKITARDRGVWDLFGTAVAVSGDTVVVGAYLDDVGPATDQGSAYVFERNLGGVNRWGQSKKLIATDGADYAQFGFSVSVSRDVVVVGANQANGFRGSAYLFERDQGGIDNWGEVKRIGASDGVASDTFGHAVAVNDDVVLVGAVQESSGPGAAYLFERNLGGANNWGESQKLTAPDGGASDTFGCSVSVSSGVILSGALFDDVTSQDQGSAYVFWRERLELASPSWANGFFHVSIVGTPGMEFSLQTSTDFNNWTSVATGNLSTDSIRVSVREVAPWGIYRAISPQAP